MQTTCVGHVWDASMFVQMHVKMSILGYILRIEFQKIHSFQIGLIYNASDQHNISGHIEAGGGGPFH